MVRLGQPFYLCDSAVYKLMYELLVKQFGKTLSGKGEKKRDEGNIKIDLRQLVTAYMHWLKDTLNGRVWYIIGEHSCCVITKLNGQGFS